MRSRRLFVLATTVAFVLATLVWAAPLLPCLRTAYLSSAGNASQYGRADAMLTSWMLAWGSHALRTNPLRLFHANIFHPLPWTLAFSENLVASALLVTPIDVIWRDPVLDHNLFLLASFVLCGVGTALLVRELGGALPAAWLAGAIVAFDPFRFRTIGHVHSLSTHWMPFALLALHRCLRRGRGAVALAIAVLLVTLSSVYYAYFFLIALAVFVPAHWALGCPAAPGGRARAVAGIVAAGVGTAIVLVPYMIARDVYALSRRASEAWFFAAKGVSYLGALSDPIGYVTQRYVAGEVTVVLLGPATLVLAMVGMVAGAAPERGGRRTAAAYLLMGTVLALVSLGPMMQWRDLGSAGVPGPWVVLSAVVPGFAALRVPPRASGVAVLAVAVVAAFGAQALWARARRPATRVAVVVLFAAIAVLESWHPPFGFMRVPWGTRGAPPVYAWLGSQPGDDAVVELPVGLPMTDAAAMVMSAAHWKPLVNGYSGFTPTMFFFREFLLSFPNAATVRLLHELGVRWVVAHPAQFPRGRAGICKLASIPPWVKIVWIDATTCVFEIVDAPPAPVPPADQPVSLAGATVTTADRADASATIDGRLDTHWVEPVDPAKESWLQIDLPEPHAVSRLVVELGPHFGEFMRRWRVDTSLDGVAWEPAGADSDAMPPLTGMRTDPAHLRTEMRIDAPAPARHLRLLRPKADASSPFDLWGNWKTWGVHEVQIFEAVP